MKKESPNKPFAAIDIGANSIHLVVADVDRHGNLTVIDSEKATVRLSSYLDNDQYLSKAGIALVVQTLKHLLSICTTYTDLIRVVATYVAREARNENELLRAVASATGIRIEVIDGAEEARLSHLGIRQGLHLNNKRFLALDVGGGSTEVIVGKNDVIDFVCSLRLGAVVLTNKYLFRKKNIKSSLALMEKKIVETLSPHVQAAEELEFELAVGCSGTIKAIALIHSQIFHGTSAEMFNGYEFSTTDLQRVYKTLALAKKPGAIAKRFKIDAKRAEIILAGTAVVLFISRAFGVKKWKVSDFGLREGIAIDFAKRVRSIESHTFEHQRWYTVLSFAKKFGVDKNHAKRVADTAVQLYRDFFYCYATESEEVLDINQELLRAAAYLHEIGKYVNAKNHHRHSYFLVLNSSLMGFTQSEKEMIGLIILLHRKSLSFKNKVIHDPIVKEKADSILELAACLRLATALNRTRQNRIQGPRLFVNPQGRVILSGRYLKTGEIPEAELFRVGSELENINNELDTKIVPEILAARS